MKKCLIFIETYSEAVSKLKRLKTQLYAYSTDCEKSSEIKAKATTAAYRKAAVEKILDSTKLMDISDESSDEFFSESKFHIIYNSKLLH